MKILNGPVMWVLLGAVLGGGGVYTLGLSRAQAPVHIGEVRPADVASAASGAAPSGVPAGAASNALAANAAPAGLAARASAPAAPVPGAAPKAPRPEGDHRLLAKDEPVTDQTAAERSSAFAANAAAPAKAPKADKPAPVAAPKLVPRTTLASSGSVRYGLAGRSELMGRGAGPVYNLKGSGGAAGGTDVNSLIKQMGTMMQGAQQQIDQAPMDAAAKAKLRQDVQGATAGLPGQ